MGTERERWMTLNLVGIIAGLIVIITIPLPWISIVVNVAAPLFSFRWDISLVGIIDLMRILQNIVTGVPCPTPCPLNPIINLIQAKADLYIYTTLTVITLLIIGGVITFFHGFIGGGVSLIAAVLFSILVGDIFTSYNIRLPIFTFEIGMGFGFVLVWIASVLALISQIIRLKAPQLVSITIWRKGIYYEPTPPYVAGGPTVGFSPTYIRCPKCGTENSASALYCRNCGTRLTI